MTTVLDFNKPLLNNKNEPMGKILLSDSLAQALMNSSVKPPIDAKYFLWGMELGKTGILKVDDIDKKILSDFIDNSESLTVLGRGRLRQVFENKI